MGLVVYNDVLLPNSIIMAGISGKNIRMNERVQNQGGYDSVNVIWQRTLRQFQIGIKPMKAKQWRDLENLFEVTDAGAFGFLMEDPKDYTVDVGDGFMQPLSLGLEVGAFGSGYGVPSYQLYKRSAVMGSTRTKDRKITRVQTSALLKRGAATLVEGVGAGQVSINRDTGIVTFVADNSQAISSIVTGPSTVINFADGLGMVAAMSVGQRVYLASITGSAAATLNGKSHVVASKGLTSITLSVDTAGMVANAGTAYKYPQTTETLTWSGKFYLPVHFMDDSIDWELVRPGDYDDRLFAGPSVSLIEIRE